ncbi:hypothetical protein [Lewinella sp. JB7]|uniref:ribbon-helix-helix domain-containing protein n=1 Tax=Lewinella sp. JB7 TaxID=2962887 RepID=UPI0020CA0E3A|nr:hypothetical protein [Lewinella sp. JB7]MCP9237903.1 hypothetical protein [Lewinella sp. JB7]
MSRKTIQFGEGQTEYIAKAVKERGYRSDSEYIRDLVRRDEEKNRAHRDLQAEIRQGLESGVSAKKVPDILKGVEQQMRKDGRL